MKNLVLALLCGALFLFTACSTTNRSVATPPPAATITTTAIAAVGDTLIVDGTAFKVTLGTATDVVAISISDPRTAMNGQTRPFEYGKPGFVFEGRHIYALVTTTVKEATVTPITYPSGLTGYWMNDDADRRYWTVQSMTRK